MIEIIINLSILLFLSALFSGAETAFTSLTPTKVEVVKNDKKFASRTIFWLYKRLDVVIMVNLIVSNLVNIMISSYITILATGFLPGGEGLAYAVGTGTILILVFGEILPKKLAILAPIAFSRFSAHILYILYYILYPITIPLSKTMKLFDKFAYKDGKNENDVSEEEITAMLAMGKKDGVLEHEEYKMIQRLLDFNDKKVVNIMTRRSDVISVHQDTTVRELLEIASEYKLSRFPVFAENSDEADWIISIPKIIPFLTDVKTLEKKVKDLKPDKAFKIPESKIIDDLFFEFQKKRVHIALVLNEYGEITGLITLEDIVEAVFGDIEDETDEREVKVKKLNGSTILCDGDVSIKEIEEVLEVSISDDEILEEKSISWLVLEKLHEFPVAGQIIELKDKKITITVMDMDDEYIDKVKVSKV